MLFPLCEKVSVNRNVILSNSKRCLTPNVLLRMVVPYVFSNKNSVIILYNTFLCVSLLCCLEKAADPLLTDDRDLKKGVESLDLLSYDESRWSSFFFSHFVLSCSPSGCKVPALDLKRNIGSSFYPRLLTAQWESIILFMNGHVCFLSVTTMHGICCTKALFVCSLIILYFLSSMECAGCSALLCIISYNKRVIGLGTATMGNNKYTVWGCFFNINSIGGDELLYAGEHIKQLADKTIHFIDENHDISLEVSFFQQNFQIFSALVFCNVKICCF